MTKSFVGLVALNRVDFDIKEGETVGLIGQNGAGKTTLLNSITGVHPAETGSITFEGHDITRLSPDRITKLGIARTFQIPQPFYTLSALENVVVPRVFGGDPCSLADAEEQAHLMLDFVGLSHKAELLPQSLNIVELRRLELARALACGARLLLLDEINAGLTAPELKEAMLLIEKVRQKGMTILMVEHVMRVIMTVCERIIVLHFGKKIAEGTPREIAGDPTVISAYLGEKQAFRGRDGARS